LSGNLGRAAGENVGNYAYSIGSVAASTPSNYTTSLTAGTFGITPATLTITATPGQSTVYGTSDPAGGFTYGNAGLVSGVTPTYWNSAGQYVAAATINDSVSGKLGRAAGENVGSYAYSLGTVAASIPGNYTTSLTAGTFGITPATLTITATGGQSTVYGTSDPSGGFIYGSSGLVNGVTPSYWNSAGVYTAASTINDTLSGNLGRAAGENVGNYAYSLGTVAANTPSNYTTSLTAGTFGITPATLTVTATGGQSIVYGTSDPLGGFGYTNTGLVNGVTPSYWNSAGQYVAAATINDSVSGKIGRAAGENVGTYAYTLGSFTANSNYTTSFTGGSFAITPATLTITATGGQSTVYGTSDPLSGFGYGNTGLVNGVTPSYWNSAGQYVAATIINDTLSGNLGRAAGENVGNYAYSIGSVAASTPSNYTTSLTAGTFGITPATLTITATPGQSTVYGTSDSAAGFGYGNTGLVTGVTPSYWNSAGQYVAAATINNTLSGNLGRTTGENVGNYAYSLGTVAVSTPSNYTTSLTAGTFGITPATLTITATGGQSTVYGTSDSAGGFTYGNTGLVSGVTPSYWNSVGQYVAATIINDTLSGNLGRAAGENVGNYAYSLGTVAASTPSNYTTSLTAGTFGITPATLTVTATAGQSTVYGTSDPLSGFGYTNTGLVNGVTPSYWNSAGQYVAAATINNTLNGNLGRAAGENVGNYNYTLGTVAASTPSNYTTKFTAGIFAITPATLTITAISGQSVAYGASDPAGGFLYSSTGLVNGVTPNYWNSAGSYVAAVTINDTLSGNLSRAAGSNVGTYPYNLGTVIASAPSNYTTSLTPGTFAITSALPIPPVPPTPTIPPTPIVPATVPATGNQSANFNYGNNAGVVTGATASYWNNVGVNGNSGGAAGEVVVVEPSTYTTGVTTAAVVPVALASTTAGKQSTAIQSATSTTSGISGSDNNGGVGLVNGITPNYWNSANIYTMATAINDTMNGNWGPVYPNGIIGLIAVGDPSNYTTSLTTGTFGIMQMGVTLTATDTGIGYMHSDTGLVHGVTPSYWSSSGLYTTAKTGQNSEAGNDVTTGFVKGMVPNYWDSVGNYIIILTPGSFAVTAELGNVVSGLPDSVQLNIPAKRRTPLTDVYVQSAVSREFRV